MCSNFFVEPFRAKPEKVRVAQRVISGEKKRFLVTFCRYKKLPGWRSGNRQQFRLIENLVLGQ